MDTDESNASEHESLLQRVNQLEHQVASLEKLVVLLAQGQAVDVSQIASKSPAAAVPPTPPPQPVPPMPPHMLEPRPKVERQRIRLPDHMRSGEYWLNKVGIGLLLFGVVFLFKYSVDRGWLTPPIRIALGMVLGAGLMVLGIRLWSQRRHFAKVLLGGGIATWYITDFAAFQLFELISHTSAFGLMAGVTLIAFVLSLRQDDAILSLIGALGGLGTPFMLYTGAGNMPGLMVYTGLLLAGMGAIYLYKGWRSLLFVSVVGGWIVYGLAIMGGFPNRADQWAFQWGVVWAWLMFWAVPLVREVLYKRDPAHWPRPPVERFARFFASTENTVAEQQTYLLSVSTPLIALVFTMGTWTLSSKEIGLVWLAGAAVYAIAAWRVEREGGLVRLAYAQGLVGLLLFTVGLCFLLHGDTLIVTLATEAAVLVLIGRRVHDRIITGVGHALFGIVALWLVSRLTGGSSGFAASAADVWAIALGMGLSPLMRTATTRRAYFLVAYGCLTLFFFRELNENLWLWTVTVQAVLLHLLARIGSDTPSVRAAHVYFGVAGAIFISRLGPLALLTADYPVRFAEIWTLDHLASLTFLAAAAGVTLLLRQRDERVVYLGAAHIGMMIWLYRMFVALDGGQGYVSIAWGVYSISLLVAGLRMDQRNLRVAGMATMFVVVGKLFLVDLAQIQAIWRVLLFMGFGGAMLALSYYFRALWSGRPDTSPPKDHVAD